MKRWGLTLIPLIVGFALGTLLVGSWSNGQPNAQPLMPRELTSYREVVKRVLPAVVSIETRAKANVARRLADDLHLPEEFRRAPGKPVDPGRLGFGSGFFIDSAGVVVTNYHVVEGAETAIVHMQDGRKIYLEGYSQ